MSDSTYTKKLKPDLKMPNNPVGTGDLGIRYHGPVLTGLLGVNQQLERQAVSSPQTSAQVRGLAPGRLDSEHWQHIRKNHLIP